MHFKTIYYLSLHGEKYSGISPLKFQEFWILLWAFGGFPWLGNFFYSYCLCLHSCKNKYKNSVIPAVYIFENGTSGLGFHLARCLDILEVLLLLLLGYCQDIVAFLWVSVSCKGLSGARKERALQVHWTSRHSLMPVLCLLANKSQLAQWNSVWDFISL